MTRFSDLEKFLLALVAVGGSLILFFPIQYLLIAVLGLAGLIYLLANPKICFYLILIFSTYVPAFATESQQMPFNQTDILITICFVSVFGKFLSNPRRINLSTKLDLWLILLLIVYFFSGFTSLAHNGYQGFLKYGETVAVFYMTIYFLRTKEIKLSELVKVILFVGIFQALYGILQSVTGSFGANFQSARGYLGNFGLGSSLVWHGRGTFGHFNSLGPFLSTVFLFFLPINHFIAKNKKNGKIILLILFFGVITTYSRGSLMALIAGFAFFLFQIQKNKIKFILTLSPLIITMLGIWNFLKNTSYVSTLSPRDETWAIAISALTSSNKILFFGSGLKSYLDVASPYFPVNGPRQVTMDYFPHNFILYYAVEIGIIGTGIILLFLINNLITAYRNIKNRQKLFSALGSSISIVLVAFTVGGMFDMALNSFVAQIWLYLMLGMLYAKNPELYTRNI